MLDLFNLIRLIPKFIGAIFSFLPPWALVLAGSGSLLFFGVIVYKLVR